MKILLVSMPSLHFFRWTEQLKNAGHEVYWFDIVDGGTKVERLNWLTQIIGWKIRWNFPGRIFLKKKFNKFYQLVQKVNERKAATVFEQKLKEIKPDVVHSFALYVSCTPILEVMLKYKSIKWIYSSWGSDLFYFQNKPDYLKDIKSVLPRVNYLFTDCKRDYKLAVKYGFTGEFLGVFPGGGGFDLEQMSTYLKPLKERNIILIKGYEGRSGRAINVLKAIQFIKDLLCNYKIVVFGADKEVFQYVLNSELNNWENFKTLGKIPHEQVLQLMGESLLYIGNSNSDGMPNTLLEAICMGAFPIQSNPGAASEEIIKNGVNGLLIQGCEDIDEIKANISKVILSLSFVKNAVKLNLLKIRHQFNREKIRIKIIYIYSNLCYKIR